MRDIDCPHCSFAQSKKTIKMVRELTIIEKNYSGCGVDIGYCKDCNRKFQISYKVDKIQEIKNNG